MAFSVLTFLMLLLGCVCAAPANDVIKTEKVAVAPQDLDQEKDDLKTAASSYTRRYSDWSGSYPGGGGYSGYGVTGYGTLDDRYSYNTYGGYGGYGGYDNTYGYGSSGYPGYSGYIGNTGYGGYKGSGGYGLSGYGGNGGYGGYGGNGGLTSYYGYNSPYNQGAYHLGYGYYNKRPGYGNIYSNGITPSLVTGYRGYSRR